MFKTHKKCSWLGEINCFSVVKTMPPKHSMLKGTLPWKHHYQRWLCSVRSKAETEHSEVLEQIFSLHRQELCWSHTQHSQHWTVVQATTSPHLPSFCLNQSETQWVHDFNHISLYNLVILTISITQTQKRINYNTDDQLLQKSCSFNS